MVDQSELAFHLVKPATTHRPVVHIMPSLLRGYCAGIGVPVGGVTAEDQVLIESRRREGIAIIQQAKEFLMLPARLALRNHALAVATSTFLHNCRPYYSHQELLNFKR
jgi:hypothetical protein